MIKKNVILKILIVFLIIILIYDVINAKHFNLMFAINKNDPTIDVEKINFKGKLIKFPLNIYYIKAKLVIGNNEYIVKKYKKEDRYKNLKLDTYRIKFIDKNNSDYFYGDGCLTGNLLNDNAESIHIYISDILRDTGEYFNAYLIE